MPGETDRILEAREEAETDPFRPLPYVSKSRLTEYVKCPMKFYFTYVMGLRSEGNFYTARGTEVHQAFEDFYENVEADPQGALREKFLSNLLPGIETGHGRRGAANWADHIQPYIQNFLKFENRRRDASHEWVVEEHGEPMNDADVRVANELLLDKWRPFAVEAEGWLDYEWNDPRWNVPLMGFADLIAWSASIPEVEADHGVTIVDFKTGSVPDEQYRDEGIFLEGEFYAMVFEDILDVEITAVAGYYPKKDTVIVSPLKQSRRDTIDQKLHEMVALSFHAEQDYFPLKEQPLCAWSNANGEGMCDHYERCDSTWGLPVGHGPTYQHAVDAKPEGFLEQESQPKQVGGIYDLGSR